MRVFTFIMKPDRKSNGKNNYEYLQQKLLHLVPNAMLPAIPDLINFFGMFNYFLFRHVINLVVVCNFANVKLRNRQCETQKSCCPADENNDWYKYPPMDFHPHHEPPGELLCLPGHRFVQFQQASH